MVGVTVSPSVGHVAAKIDGDSVMHTVEEHAEALTEGRFTSRALVEAPPLPLRAACTVARDELQSNAR
jgi:hypothetical protein